MVTNYPDGMRAEDWAHLEGDGLDRVANRIIDTLVGRGIEEPTAETCSTSWRKRASSSATASASSTERYPSPRPCSGKSASACSRKENT